MSSDNEHCAKPKSDYVKDGMPTKKLIKKIGDVKEGKNLVGEEEFMKSSPLSSDNQCYTKNGVEK